MQHVGGLHGYIRTLVSIHHHQFKHFLEIFFPPLPLIPATVSRFASNIFGVSHKATGQAGGMSEEAAGHASAQQQSNDHQTMAFFFFFFFFFISPTLTASQKGAEK